MLKEVRASRLVKHILFYLPQTSSSTRCFYFIGNSEVGTIRNPRPNPVTRGSDF